MADDPDADDSPPPDTDRPNGGTTKTAYRWRYLSTVVTFLVVLVYSVAFLWMLSGEVAAADTGTWTAYSVAFLAAMAYSVGIDTLQAARDARQ